MGTSWRLQEGIFCRWASSTQCLCGRSSAAVQRSGRHLQVDIGAAQQAGLQMAGCVEQLSS